MNVLAAQSFKDELAHYQTMAPRHATIIARWRDTAGVDKMWRDLQAVAQRHGKQPLEPVAFIESVFSASYTTAKLVGHNSKIKEDLETLKRDLKTRVDRCRYPDELRRILQDYDEPARLLEKSAYDIHRTPISRKNQAGSRDRIAFIQRMGRFFKRNCGEWCEREIANLLDIALPRGKLTASEDEVKHALRAIRGTRGPRRR